MSEDDVPTTWNLPPVDPNVKPVQPPRKTPPPKKSHKSFWIAVAALVVALLTLAGLIWATLSKPPVPGPSPYQEPQVTVTATETSEPRTGPTRTATATATATATKTIKVQLPGSTKTVTVEPKPEPTKTVTTDPKPSPTKTVTSKPEPTKSPDVKKFAGLAELNERLDKEYNYGDCEWEYVDDYSICDAYGWMTYVGDTEPLLEKASDVLDLDGFRYLKGQNWLIITDKKYDAVSIQQKIGGKLGTVGK